MFRSTGLGPADGAIAILRNGQSFHTGIKDPGTGGDWYWREANADLMWPFVAGDVLSLQVWNLGLYAYHSSYSRLQVQYLGPLQ